MIVETLSTGVVHTENFQILYFIRFWISYRKMKKIHFKIMFQSNQTPKFSYSHINVLSSYIAHDIYLCDDGPPKVGNTHDGANTNNHLLKNEVLDSNLNLDLSR